MSWLGKRRNQKNQERARYIHQVQVGLAVLKIQKAQHNREIMLEARRWLELKRLAEHGQMERELPADAAHQAIETGLQPHREPQQTGQEGREETDQEEEVTGDTPLGDAYLAKRLGDHPTGTRVTIVGARSSGGEVTHINVRTGDGAQFDNVPVWYLTA